MNKPYVIYLGAVWQDLQRAKHKEQKRTNNSQDWRQGQVIKLGQSRVKDYLP